MALIIKGEMPTCCWYCDRDLETNCPITESNEGYEEWKNIVNEVRHPDCPIIGEIPDRHGDLKDANAILRWLNAKADNRVPVTLGEIIDFIEKQPTVLEASE